jgi:hypothetical protein
MQLQWRRFGMVNSSVKVGACKSTTMWGFATSTEIYGAGYHDICTENPKGENAHLIPTSGC